VAVPCDSTGQEAHRIHGQAEADFNDACCMAGALGGQDARWVSGRKSPPREFAEETFATPPDQGVSEKRSRADDSPRPELQPAGAVAKHKRGHHKEEGSSETTMRAPAAPRTIAVFSRETREVALQRHRELPPDHAGRLVRFEYRNDERNDVREMFAVHPEELQAVIDGIEAKGRDKPIGEQMLADAHEWGDESCPSSLFGVAASSWQFRRWMPQRTEYLP